MADIQGGLQAGLGAAKDRFGDLVRLLVHDARDPAARRILAGWQNLPVLRSEGNREQIANVSSPSSSEPSAKAPSASRTDGKPSATSQTLEQWLDESMRKMEQLDHDEMLRREIARRLS